jgi:molybdenum cofactor cytidylyltransferase
VLGAPGCARSPKENGFDWVLDRLLADVPVTAQDIRRMGAGGLLMEIVSRPQPRGGEASRAEPDNGDD